MQHPQALIFCLIGHSAGVALPIFLYYVPSLQPGLLAYAGRRASTINAEQRKRPRQPDGSFSSFIDSVRNGAPSCFSKRGVAAW